MQQTQYNYAALGNHYSPSQVMAHFKTYGGWAVLKVVLLLFMAVCFGFIGLVLTAAASAGIYTQVGAVPAVFPWILYAMLMGSGLWLAAKSMVNAVVLSLRIRDFAAANNMTFQENIDPGQEAGLIFNRGHSRKFSRLLTLNDENHSIVGNYQYTTGSGKQRQTYTFGVARFNITRKLPHTILDATANDVWGINSMGSFGDDQRIELEGDFNQYFSVFTPSGYGKDALYWLTPELMELLKNHVAQFDIEVVDNFVYLYIRRSIPFTEEGLSGILGVMDWLHDEFEQNTRRYSDERIGSFAANIVSEQGKRLKTKVPWWVILIGVLYAGIQIARILQ